jgi:Ca2+-binding EF-hand superfamily protein
VLGNELSTIDDKIWNDIIAEVDYNKDGAISFDEFCKMMNKFAEESINLS